MYRAEKGAVEVDGVDLNVVDPTWWRERVSVVSQHPTLFSGNIRDNIAYGWNQDVPPTQEQIELAASEAFAHDFITSFPEGYDTMIGERGVALSGGQKQRIAIARALLKRPKVLLLDEATSALDAASENAVQQALERAMQNRTVLVVAHRLSTVMRAHQICVLREGRVAESGTHDELVQNPNGIYYDLMQHQFGGFHTDSDTSWGRPGRAEFERKD